MYMPCCQHLKFFGWNVPHLGQHWPAITTMEKVWNSWFVRNLPGLTRKFVGPPGRRPELLGFTSKIKILKPITETVTKNPRKSLPRNKNRNSQPIF